MSDASASIPDLSAQLLREKFGLSKGYASDLINRNRRPSLELAVKIEQEFGIPASAWMEPKAEAAA